MTLEETTDAGTASRLSDGLEGDAVKICEDCRHLTELGLCKSPENGVSMVTGRPTPMWATERRSAGISLIFTGTAKCGPEAKNFTPKPTPKQPKRPWWKFWKGTKPAPSNDSLS